MGSFLCLTGSETIKKAAMNVNNDQLRQILAFAILKLAEEEYKNGLTADSGKLAEWKQLYKDVSNEIEQYHKIVFSLG